MSRDSCQLGPETPQPSRDRATDQAHCHLHAVRHRCAPSRHATSPADVVFVSDGDERTDPDGGCRTVLSRMVSATHGAGDANGRRIVVDSADGPDSRTFDLDEHVEVHIIAPGETMP